MDDSKKADEAKKMMTKMYKGQAMPPFFVPESCEAFGQLELEDTDIIVNSQVRCGTTWVNKIVFNMLRMTDEGVIPEEMKSTPGADVQVYIDGVGYEKAGGKPYPPWDKFSFMDVCNQPRPRMFATHLQAQFMPASLESRGRLLYVIRNPKDAMVSMHFFHGEKPDGFLGNEKGPGSYNRYIAEPCTNPYGSFFDHLKGMQQLVDAPEMAGRVKVIYFEELKADLPGQLMEIAKFLNVPLPQTKLDAIVQAVSFEGLKKDGGARSDTLLRKGEVGDWKNHIDAEHWAKFDQIFEERVGHLEIAKPLKQWM